MVININGKLLPQDVAFVPYNNRAFRYGYGLFETLLIKDGTIELEDLHWARLLAGMNTLEFELPKHFTSQHLSSEVLKTVRKNKLEALCRVRLQVWPGNGGLYDATSFAPQFIIECFTLPIEVVQFNENGLVAGIAQGLAKSMDILANLKTSNALIYSQAARQAKMHKWNDALILNAEGRIIESSIANLFWVAQGKIFTPPLSEGSIAGVMREFILQLAASKSIFLEEKILTLDELGNAEEMFLTNSIKRIKWIRTVEAQSFSNDISRQLFAWIAI